MARRAIPLTVTTMVALTVLVGCGADEPGPGPTTQTGQPTSTSAVPPTSGSETAPWLETFELPGGAGPHDVAPAADGGVWFTAQRAGYLGHFDPASRAVTEVPLGSGSRPHGVIVGADGAAWVTDGGLNAIVRVDGATRDVRCGLLLWPLTCSR